VRRRTAHWRDDLLMLAAVLAVVALGHLIVRAYGG
jgi:hypothetical protein